MSEGKDGPRVKRLEEQCRKEGRVFPPQPSHILYDEYIVAKRQDEEEHRKYRRNLGRGLMGVYVVCIILSLLLSEWLLAAVLALMAAIKVLDNYKEASNGNHKLRR